MTWPRILQYRAGVLHLELFVDGEGFGGVVGADFEGVWGSMWRIRIGSGRGSKRRHIYIYIYMYVCIDTLRRTGDETDGGWRLEVGRQEMEGK